MKYQDVTSSNLRCVGYDETCQVLEVEFKNDTTYQYAFVTPEVYKAVLEAESVGSALDKLVKKGPGIVYRRLSLKELENRGKSRD